MRVRILPIVAVLGSIGVAHAADTARHRVIDRSNVHQLTLAWSHDAGDSIAPVGGRGKPPAFEATPVYAEDRLYYSTPQGSVLALDAETGKEAWRADLGVNRRANYSDPANRGVTLAGKRLFVGTIDGRLVCLRVGDGTRCSDFGQNGEVDLTAGLRRKPLWAGEYGVTSPPAVYRNLVIVGSSVADNSRTLMSSGEVRAFDVETGKLVWTFHPLPAKAAAGGANTWSRMTVDERRGLVFLPTGSPSPDYFGGLRAGDNTYANSVVALQAATGEVVWHFQTVRHDLWDYDVASPPLLFPFNEARGRSTDAVAVGSKTGHLFLLDRATGAPLFPVENRTVPASDVVAELAARTQPFPSKPAALVPQQVTMDDVWGETPADRDACAALLKSLRNDGVFTPPSVQGSLHVPGNIGGLHWGGVTWDASERLLIAPVNRMPAVIRLIARDDLSAARKSFPDRETTAQTGAAFAMSREFFRAPSGAPCIAPPWGELVAVHADTGELAWRVPLGEVPPNMFGNRTPVVGSPNLGGAAVTGTGVLFIGTAFDGFLRAFDTRNGRELWRGALPTSARATPLVFTTKRGSHMIAIASGGYDVPNSRIDTVVSVFALK